MPKFTVTTTIDTDEVEKSTWDGETAQQTVLKSVDEQQFTLSVGYPAMLADAAVARDGHRDFANAGEVEKAAWRFMANGGEVGLHHADGTEGHGTVVESYIWRGPDTDFDGQKVCKGDWLVGIVWDDSTWDAIKKGRINGTSMQGKAQRKVASPADVARAISKRG